MMSEPASMAASWMARIVCGWVIESRSLLPLSSLGWSAKRSPRKSSSERSYDWIMVPMAQSSNTMRCFNKAPNSSSRTCLSSCFVCCTIIDFRSIQSTFDTDRLDHVPGEFGGAGRRHDVRPADQRLCLGEQLLGNLDAVLRGVLGGEGGQPLADVPGDTYAGD